MRVRCYACRQMVTVLSRGHKRRLADHTTDHDGPGIPYDCPGGGLHVEENEEKRRQRRRDDQRDAYVAGAAIETASREVLTQYQLTKQQVEVIDRLVRSGLFGADAAAVTGGILSAGLRDAHRWLVEVESRGPQPAARIPDRTKGGYRP